MTTMNKVVVGKPAPDFHCTAVVDGSLKEISLDSYSAASHWLILVFFPKAWSFICPTEIRAFSARLEEFLYSRQCAVVFASTDNEHSLKAWNATSEMEGGLGGAHVPLISDSNHKLSKDYGVLIEEEGVAQRALFIIDKQGIVRSMTVNDADVGRSVDETQRVLDALVFKDEFGEGCPVDWKKGDKGLNYADKIKPDGPIELKKSWSEWARPKLQRAWSGQSGRSINSMMSNASFNGTSRLSGEHSGYQSALASGRASPMISPTKVTPTSAGIVSGRLRSPSNRSFLDVQMDEAVVAQNMENIKAALSNQALGQGVGVAN